MNIFAETRTVILETLDAMVADSILPNGLSWGNVAVEPPRDAAHGDMATNAAMVLAKPAGQPPRAIADVLAERLAGQGAIESAEVAGPGFINLRLKADVWHDLVAEAIDADVRDGADRDGDVQHGVRVDRVRGGCIARLLEWPAERQGDQRGRSPGCRCVFHWLIPTDINA